MAAPYYLLPNEMVLYYDARRVLELANDKGDGSATTASLSRGGSDEYQIIAAAISTVSAEIDAALQVGSIYARTDLEGLIAALTDPLITADSVLLLAATKRAALLKQMVADLTFGRLMARRGYTAAAMKEMAPQYDGALQMLLDLAGGRRVFDLDANKSAGVPSTVEIGTFGTGRLVSVQASPLFGSFGSSNFSPLFPLR